MENKNGTLKILNKKVIYTPPEKDGLPPKIVPTKGLTIFVNDLPINSPTIIKSSDKIKIETKEELLEKGKVDFKVSPDSLSAWIFLSPHQKAHYSLLESGEKFILEPPVQQEIFQEPVATLTEIKNLLKEKNIIYGLDEAALEEAVLQMNGKWMEIAQGTAPTSGQNAHIEIFFEQEQKIAYQIDDINNVNYLDKGHIPAVEKDTLLAKKTPAMPGKAGISVLGEEIPPPDPQDISLLAGQNTYYKDKDELKIFSKLVGRPVLEKTKKYYKIQVLPVYTVNGDVDITTGHVHFQGDVQINGNVQERMEVLAGGHITIYGNVNGANIRTAGSIEVSGNVIKSRLTAGARQFFTMQALPGILMFSNTLNTILKAFQQIKETPQFKNARFGYILSLLVEKKFPHFSVQLEKLTKILDVDLKEDFSLEMIAEVAFLKQKLEEFSQLPYQDLKKALELLEKATLLKKKLSKVPQERNDITARYCLNSRLEASGSVTITGSGSFHTDIISQKNITVSGVVRGGTISAKKDIKVNEAGSEAAIATTMIVPRKQKVYINKAFTNTIIQIGKYTYKFSRERSKVKVFVRDEDETIVIDNF